MASHYSDIGYQVSGIQDIQKIIAKYQAEGEDIETPNGRYLVVRPDDYIEFWVQLDKRENIVQDLEFHYSSDNTIPVRVEEWMPGRPDSPMFGALNVWYGELFPMIVDVPNADLHRSLTGGDTVAIQAACFAEQLELFPDSEAYYAAQDREPGFSDEFFIPSGMFSATENPSFVPSAHVMFAGHIQTWEKRRNSYSNRDYYYFAITCQGAVFDVLADPEFISAEPVIDGVLSGVFWISGKIVEP